MAFTKIKSADVLPKPERVEVGQRWRFRSCPYGVLLQTVDRIDGDAVLMNTYQGEFEGGWDTKRTMLSDDRYEYLGPATQEKQTPPNHHPCGGCGESVPNSIALCPSCFRSWDYGKIDGEYTNRRSDGCHRTICRMCKHEPPTIEAAKAHRCGEADGLLTPTQLRAKAAKLANVDTSVVTVERNSTLGAITIYVGGLDASSIVSLRDALLPDMPVWVNLTVTNAPWRERVKLSPEERLRTENRETISLATQNPDPRVLSMGQRKGVWWERYQRELCNILERSNARKDPVRITAEMVGAAVAEALK